MASDVTPSTAGREIATSRTLQAPRELVFRAWTEAGHLKNWWGPAGFTNTFHEFDVRPGGKWSFVMHGPEKGHYRNECEFTKVEAPSLLAWKRFTNPLFEVVTTFEEDSAGTTKVVFRQIFPSEADCNKVRAIIEEKNEEVFDRLERELRMMKTASEV